MVAGGRTLLTAAVLGAAALLAPQAALAQPLPPAPVPVAPSADLGPPAPVLGPPVAAPYPVPPTPPPPPPPPSPFAPPGAGPNAWVDAPACEEGYFFNTELEFLKPHVNNRLNGTVTFPDGTTDTLQLPQADLGWTVAPRFELGYRLPDSFGSLSASYRFLVSEGSGTVFYTDGTTADLRSRLDLNQFDFDYIAATYSPVPFWDLKWRVGARLADVYFDTQTSNGLFEQKSSNNFIGAGPHFTGEAERRFGLVSGLSAYGRLDGSVLVGQIHQRFHEGFFLADGTTFAGDGSVQRTQSVPTLTLDLGLSYTPPRMEFLHFSAGYEFERWWEVGSLGASRGDLTDQGVFLRGEFDY